MILENDLKINVFLAAVELAVAAAVATVVASRFKDSDQFFVKGWIIPAQNPMIK